MKQFVQAEFGEKKFEQIANPLGTTDRKHDDKYKIFDLRYHEDELSVIEKLISSDKDGFTIQVGGEILITRKFLATKSDQEGSFSLYTFIRRGRLDEDISTNSKASIVMVHGNSENSDSYLEIGIHHALNDLEVHLIDLKGQGLSSGEKNGHFKI